MINLNNSRVKIDSFPNGKTQNIQIKMGRKLYYLDIDKNNESCFIDFYKKTGTDRSGQSKYSSAIALGVVIRPNAVLERDFFESIDDIKKAQEVYKKFGYIIK